MQFNYGGRVWDTFSDEHLQDTKNRGLKMATIIAYFGSERVKVLLNNNKDLDLLFELALMSAQNEDIVVLSTNEGVQHANASPELVMKVIDENDTLDRELWLREIFELADKSSDSEKYFYNYMKKELKELRSKMKENELSPL